MSMWNYIVRYANRAAWENGEPCSAEVREYDEDNNLLSSSEIPPEDCPDADAGWEEVDDGGDDVYSAITIYD